MIPIRELLNSHLPQAVEIREVGPRDGLQNEAGVVPTASKIAFINKLSRTGLKTVQATSFVRPDAVVQLADAEDVLKGITRQEGVTYSVLVPNLRGAERAAECKADEWVMMLSASQEHSRRNSRRSVEQSLSEIGVIAALARQHGVVLRGGMSMALGCPWEGVIPVERLAAIVRVYLDHGVTDINISDTAGLAQPRGVGQTASQLVEMFPQARFVLHLHDTRSFAVANAFAGLLAGIRIFEGSVAGLGGCPFVPGARGNVATETLVDLFHSMGIATGVDLAKLREVGAWISHILGRPADVPAVAQVADRETGSAGR